MSGDHQLSRPQKQRDLVLTKVLVKRCFNTRGTLLTFLNDRILRDPSDLWSTYEVTGFTRLQIPKMQTQETLINKISKSTINQMG